MAYYVYRMTKSIALLLEYCLKILIIDMRFLQTLKFVCYYWISINGYDAIFVLFIDLDF